MEEKKESIHYIILKEYKVKAHMIKNYGFKEFTFLTLSTVIGYVIGQVYFDPLGQLISTTLGLLLGFYMGAKSSKTPKRNRLESSGLFLKFSFDTKTLRVRGYTYAQRYGRSTIQKIKSIVHRLKNRK